MDQEGQTPRTKCSTNKWHGSPSINNKYMIIMKEKIYTLLNHAKTPLAYENHSTAIKIKAASIGRVK
jgi:hypothetical protein